MALNSINDLATRQQADHRPSEPKIVARNVNVFTVPRRRSTTSRSK
jgi:hypothetical protein